MGKRMINPNIYLINDKEEGGDKGGGLIQLDNNGEFFQSLIKCMTFILKKQIKSQTRTNKKYPQREDVEYLEERKKKKNFQVKRKKSKKYLQIKGHIKKDREENKTNQTQNTANY